MSIGTEPSGATQSGEPSIAFGSFELFPHRRVLTDDGRPIRLGSRALDILLLLVDKAGQIVGKEELIAHVWPKTFVEEANLRVHLAALRKILGEGQGGKRYIVNVVGRGYSFVAPLSIRTSPHHAHQQAPSTAGGAPLPAPLGPLLGRSEAVGTIASRLLQHRFVTICGSPGIGKTSVALAVAEHLAPSFDNHVRFVDLAPITDASQLLTAVASAIGVPVIWPNVMQSLLDHLRGMPTLIVLDNCEHVIDAAAEFCEQVLKSTANAHVLTTSRESLHAVGEHLQRLSPLPVPPEGARLRLSEALSFAAIELFITRALASQDTLEFTDLDVPVVADLCRRLDGVPLALELVAARVAQLGVHEVAKLFDDRLQVLKQGRRTALPRHQTLRATLDWSYGLLPQVEQRTLPLLSVFAGPFTSDAAIAVATDEVSDHVGVVENIGNLAAKSLLNVDVSGSKAKYRLLEMTRAYAMEKLKRDGGYEQAARRHAEYFLTLLQKSEQQYDAMDERDWLDEYGGLIDDVRLAIDWAMAGGDDSRALGVDLIDAAATLYFQLYLSDEYRKRLERALEYASFPDDVARAKEMRLCISLGIAIFNTNGPAPELAAASARALVLAEALKAESYQLRALWGLARERYSSGDYASALSFSERFGQVARDAQNEEAILVHARMMSLALHLVGKHDEARAHADVAVAPVKQRFRPNHRNFYQYDFGVTARAHLARILWVQGRHRDAIAIAEEAVHTAEATGSAISLCNALALGACPVAIWEGDMDVAQARVSMLLERSTNVSLGYWHQWGHLYQQALSLRAGRQSMEVGGERSALQIDMLGTLDPRLITFAAVQRAECGAAAWSAAEVLRGNCMTRQASEVVAEPVEDILRRALSIARAQNARSWELRCAISLAEHLCDQGRPKEAEQFVGDALAAIGDSRSADVARAKTLLQAIG